MQILLILVAPLFCDLGQHVIASEECEWCEQQKPLESLEHVQAEPERDEQHQNSCKGRETLKLATNGHKQSKPMNMNYLQGSSGRPDWQGPATLWTA